MGLFADGFKELKKASEPLYKTPKSIQEMKSDKNIGRCVDFLDECFYGGKNPYRKPLRLWR